MRTSMLRMAVLVAAAMAAGCADAAGPAPDTIRASVAGGQPFRVQLGPERPTAARATALIGPAGGRLSVAGVTLVVPVGALDEPVEIVMEVPSGRFAQVEFAPHGLVFDVPAEIIFDGTRPGIRPVFGLYIAGDIEDDGTVVGLEVIEATRSARATSFPIRHFSGYVLATG